MKSFAKQIICPWLENASSYHSIAINQIVSLKQRKKVLNFIRNGTRKKQTRNYGIRLHQNNMLISQRNDSIYCKCQSPMCFAIARQKHAMYVKIPANKSRSHTALKVLHFCITLAINNDAHARYSIWSIYYFLKAHSRVSNMCWFVSILCRLLIQYKGETNRKIAICWHLKSEQR